MHLPGRTGSHLRMGERIVVIQGVEHRISERWTCVCFTCRVFLVKPDATISASSQEAVTREVLDHARIHPGHEVGGWYLRDEYLLEEKI